jgi:hypothetical protein
MKADSAQAQRRLQKRVPQKYDNPDWDQERIDQHHGKLRHTFTALAEEVAHGQLLRLIFLRR